MCSTRELQFPYGFLTGIVSGPLVLDPLDCTYLAPPLAETVHNRQQSIKKIFNMHSKTDR